MKNNLPYYIKKDGTVVSKIIIWQIIDKNGSRRCPMEEIKSAFQKIRIRRKLNKKQWNN